jgi:hypothetical protein
MVPMDATPMRLLRLFIEKEAVLRVGETRAGQLENFVGPAWLAHLG